MLPGERGDYYVEYLRTELAFLGGFLTFWDGFCYFQCFYDSKRALFHSSTLQLNPVL